MAESRGEAAELSLEVLMPRMADHPAGLPIVSPGGEIVGQVTPRLVVRALAAAGSQEP